MHVSTNTRKRVDPKEAEFSIDDFNRLNETNPWLHTPDLDPDCTAVRGFEKEIKLYTF